MAKYVLAAVLVLIPVGAQAASYMSWSSGLIATIRSNMPGLNVPDPSPDGAHPYSGPNLDDGVSAPNAYLSGAHLAHAMLRSADLNTANLNRVSLGGAFLNGANLSFADLGDALLPGAKLNGANLACANLSGVDLASANLAGANLAGANLSGASLYNAINLGLTTGSADYDAETDFTQAYSEGNYTAPFDPVAAGWNLVVDSGVDCDGDGLSASEEAAAGTNPNLPDTDGDGFSDGVEVAAGSDPLEFASQPSPAPLPALSAPAQVALLAMVLSAGLYGLRKPRGWGMLIPH